MNNNPQVALNTRFAVSQMGINDLETVCDSWPDVTRQQVESAYNRLILAAGVLIDTVAHIDRAVTALNTAVASHPDPSLHNITINDETLRVARQLVDNAR